MKQSGVDSILKLSKCKGIDVFDFSQILIPVVKSNHWSLLVVLNPGSVNDMQGGENDSLTCILHLDSFQGTNNTNALSRMIINWLNEESKQSSKFGKQVPFSPKSLRTFIPKGETYP